MKVLFEISDEVVFFGHKKKAHGHRRTVSGSNDGAISLQSVAIKGNMGIHMTSFNIILFSTS